MASKDHAHQGNTGGVNSVTYQGALAQVAFMQFRNDYIAAHGSDNSNEEPPINLFAPFQNYQGNDEKLASEDKRNKTFNGVVDSRDFIEGDGIFSVYGHGALERNGEYNIFIGVSAE